MKPSHYILLLLLIILLSSCASQYIPPASFIPLLENKNDLKVEGTLSTNSLHAAVAYSPINHFAIMSNGNVSQNCRLDKEAIYGSFNSLFNEISHIPLPAQHLYYEGALGYFNKIGNNILYEVYLGYGRGHTKNHIFYYESIYTKPYASMNIAYSNSLISFGVSFTGAYCNYNISKYNNSNYFSDTYVIKSYEPYLFAKAKANNLELGVKVGRIFTNDYYDVDKIYLDNTRCHISLSASYLFNLSKK